MEPGENTFLSTHSELLPRLSGERDPRPLSVPQRSTGDLSVFPPHTSLLQPNVCFWAISVWPSKPVCLSAFLFRVLSSQTTDPLLSRRFLLITNHPIPEMGSPGVEPALAWLAQIFLSLQIFLNLCSLQCRSLLWADIGLRARN